MNTCKLLVLSVFRYGAKSFQPDINFETKSCVVNKILIYPFKIYDTLLEKIMIYYMYEQ